MAKVNRELRTRISRIVTPEPEPTPLRYLDDVTVTDYVRDNKAYNTAKDIRDKENANIKKQFADGYQCPLTTPYILRLQTSTRREPDWEELHKAQWVKVFFKKYHKMARAIAAADEKMAQIKAETPAKFVSSLVVEDNAAYKPPVPVVVEEETYA